jgi:hypothetical protein
MSDTFTCAVCGGTFDKGWSDEEMLAEARLHGFDLEGDNVLVCDDCFEPVMSANNHPIGERR